MVDFQLHLDSETVDHAHPTEALTVAQDTPIRTALERMKDADRGDVLVCENEILIGIFTERDALSLLAQGADLEQPISAVMIRQPVTLDAKDTVGKAIAIMSTGGYRRLPIVDDQGRPQGVLKVSGILHYLVEHFPSVIYNLPPQPHHTTQSREGA